MRHTFYYKMQRFYYKLRLLLQTATFITKCVNTQYKVNFLKPFSKCVVDSPQKKKGKEKEKELFEIIT